MHDDHIFLFKPLASEDLPTLHCWFNLPHVQAFYSLRAWTEEDVLKKMTPYITQEKPVSGYIVFFEQMPIAYVQYCRISDYPWPNQNLPKHIANHAAGLDFFIGDTQFLGKGFGKKILSAFLNEKIWSEFEYCIVDPDIENTRAIRLYESLHFHEHAVIQTENALHKPCKLKLMILKKSI